MTSRRNKGTEKQGSGCTFLKLHSDHCFTLLLNWIYEIKFVEVANGLEVR